MTEQSDTTFPYRKVCTWCKLPKFGDNRCICDNPSYEYMDTCEDCGEYTDIDKLRERSDGQYVCPRCDTLIL